MPAANFPCVDMVQPSYKTINVGDYSVMPYIDMDLDPLGDFTYPQNPPQ